MKDKYYSLLRATLPALFVAAAFALNTTAIAQAPSGSLWYNGDWDFVGSHATSSTLHPVIPRSLMIFTSTVAGGW
jgi:hypothetical protein